MRAYTLPATALAFLVALALADDSNSTSSKRGLLFIPNPKTPDDNQIWVQPGSDLTWYYNYGDQPSISFESLSQTDFEFIPMMFGVSSDLNDTSFLGTIQGLIDKGTNISHVLGFNEPDGSSGSGGSDIAPADAAQAWVANFEPLGRMGIELGMPACTGSTESLPWLQQFAANCSDILSAGGDRKNCTFDFLPVHWYSNFAGLASLIGERQVAIWITEYAFADQDLTTTQEFYNQTIDYFDKEPYIGRYSYFGAFRSKVSNVGPNAVFLNNAGHLTDIGSLYLGFEETGVVPQSAAPSSSVPEASTLAAVLFGAVLLALF